MRRFIPFSLVLLMALFGAAGIFLTPRASSPAVALAGTDLKDHPAPAFSLPDQWGKVTTLRQFHGHPVIVTFMDSTCTTLCPIATEKIGEALAMLGADGRKVGVVAISTAPEADIPATIRAFSQAHGLWQRWHFLNASRAVLTPIWKGYWIFAAPAHASLAARNTHTQATFVIDAAGRERALFTSEMTATALARDLRILLGIGSGGAMLSLPEPVRGHPAPSFALTTVSGAHVALSSLRGRPALLNFWATYCLPCRSEMPTLQTWARAHPHIRVLGIDQEESATDVGAFLRRYRITYPVALDSNGTISGRYDLVGLPTTFLIDAHGVVRATHVGTLTPSWLQAAASLH